MSDFGKDVRKLLKQNGCYLVRQGKGDHQIWYSPLSDLNVTVDTKIKSRHTANAILKQASIDIKF